MGATRRKRVEPSPGMYQCYVCKRALPHDAFLPVTVRDKRCKPGHVLVTHSYDCRECRNEKKREGRRRKAEEAGRVLREPGEWQMEQKTKRAERKAARRVAWAICLAFWALVKRSPQERIARIVERQRIRRHTDPAYQAKCKALKIKRKRAQKGTQVVPVNRELVAKRDGWKCGICCKPVTRETWSLDHVVPLSRGGTHTYDNVVLAHRSCNSKRGPGRLPVQAPLFPTL